MSNGAHPAVTRRLSAEEVRFLLDPPSTSNCEVLTPARPEVYKSGDIPRCAERYCKRLLIVRLRSPLVRIQLSEPIQLGEFPDMNSAISIEDLFKAFRDQAFNQASIFDSEDDCDWDSICIGFAVAKGAGYSEAMYLSIHWVDYCNGDVTVEQATAGFTPGMFDEDSE